MRLIAVGVVALITATPAVAQYANLRPAGAVPLLDGCNGMSGYPDCHPERFYEGRMVVVPIVPERPGRAAHLHRQWGYPAYR